MILITAIACPQISFARNLPDDGFVNFSFDSVDIASFARLVGEITGRRFVVDESVEGKLTVISPQVRRPDVYPLFISIIESAGYGVIDERGLLRIVPLPRGKAILPPVIGIGEELPADGIITRIFRLEHVSAAEIAKALSARGAAAIPLPETNHLLLTDSTEGIRRFERIITELDRPGLSRSTEVIRLEYASAEDMAQQLNQALRESFSRAEALRRRLPAVGGQVDAAPASVVAVPDSNSLIISGTASELADIKRLVTAMDIDAPTGRGRLNAIFLKHLSAEEAARSISALLKQSDPRDGRRRIAIEASIANNALLVDSSPGDFEVVRRLVEQLDLPRAQVHISVIIAEVSQDRGLDFGVEMAALKMPSEVGSTEIQGSSAFRTGADSLLGAVQKGMFPRGISVGAAYGTRRDDNGNVAVSYPGLINIDAMRRSGSVRILSETSLETQNNQEASVMIVNEIPVLTSTIEGGSGTARDVIQNIDRVDVGIKLKLTPHVIPDGIIRMALNPSIEAVIDPGPDSSMFAPTIAKREVMTTVSVRDTETIVIAGLTREDRIQSERRVPLLGSIPLLGWLFRSKSDGFEKTDVLIFVTPTITGTTETASRIRNEWQERTGLSPDELR